MYINSKHIFYSKLYTLIIERNDNKETDITHRGILTENEYIDREKGKKKLKATMTLSL